ncbi:Sphingosine N-acyltransferase, putative [Leishmania guyanensis]|uniref:TLC domain containing protein n=1 Tax=Leishmania shawi TaxID=5680 RepID=A0AAW3BDP0_9TRYP
MALQYSVETVRAQGISSPYASPAELYIPDLTNSTRRFRDVTDTTLRWSELPGAFLNIKAYQDKYGVGCSGWGVDVSLLPALLPAVYWFLAIMLIRYLCCEPFARFGIYMGVVTENSACHRRRIAAGRRGIASLSPRNQKKIIKFQNQMWLSIFYFVSSCFGYYIQRDQLWFKLPLDNEASLHILLPHPYNPSQELLTYYHYGLAFYSAELCSLFLLERHVKRSDFLEYVVHHVITVLLIFFSHVGLEHRFGAYVLFIHDTSDVMLSVSKSLHYMSQEDTARQERYNKRQAEKKSGKIYQKSIFYRYIITDLSVNFCFIVFMSLFFFFRLYCLPFTTKASIRMAKLRHGNFNMWMLVFLLNVPLQGLHVYWSVLIISMLLSLVKGGKRKDIRSDDEEDPERPSCVHWGKLTESDDDTNAKGDKVKRAHKMSPTGNAALSSSSFSTPARNGSLRRNSSKKQ